MYKYMIAWNSRQGNGLTVYGIEVFKTKKQATEYRRMMDGNVSDVLKINDFETLQRTNSQEIETFKGSIHTQVLPIQKH